MLTSRSLWVAAEQRWYPNLITLQRWSWWRCKMVMLLARLQAMGLNLIKFKPEQ